MKTVAECVIELAADRRYLGGLPAIMAVLHTWARDLNFHPHVHLLVSAGGLSEDGEHWMAPRYGQWLVPVRALSALIRGKFRAKLTKMAPEIMNKLPDKVWRQGWNVFCKPCGPDPDAVVNYVGRYVFRTAISNNRIESMDDTHVTFRFRSRKKGGATTRLRGEEFLRRFVMHILPRGFQKVRYYGLWHHSKSEEHKRIAQMTCYKKKRCPEPEPQPKRPETIANLVEAEGLGASGESSGAGKVKCPCCGSASVRLIEEISRGGRHVRSP